MSLFGNSDDDLIIAFDEGSAFGGAGDDLLIGDNLTASDTPQVLDGGYGNDVIVSHGGSVMTRGPGADTYVISPAGLDDDGNFLSANGDPLPVSVITDFDKERDALVLDLEQTYQNAFREAGTLAGEYEDTRVAPEFGDEIEITLAETDAGTMVLVNGIAFVELQGLTPEAVSANVTMDVTMAALAAA